MSAKTAQIDLEQVRSGNGASRPQLETLRSLKLGKIGRTASHEDSPQLRGMVDTVSHLVEVKEQS